MKNHQKVQVPNFSMEVFEIGQETISQSYSPSSKLSSARVENTKPTTPKNLNPAIIEEAYSREREKSESPKRAGAQVKTRKPSDLGNIGHLKNKERVAKLQQEIEEALDKAVKGVSLRSLLGVKNTNYLPENELITAFALIELLKKNLVIDGAQEAPNHAHGDSALSMIRYYFSSPMSMLEVIQSSKALYRIGKITSNDIEKSRCIIRNFKSDSGRSIVDDQTEFTRIVEIYIDALYAFSKAYPEKKFKMIPSNQNNATSPKSPQKKLEEFPVKYFEDEKQTKKWSKEKSPKQGEMTAKWSSEKIVTSQGNQKPIEERKKSEEIEEIIRIQTQNKLFDEEPETGKGPLSTDAGKEPIKNNHTPIDQVKQSKNNISTPTKNLKRKAVSHKKRKSVGSKNDRFMTREERIMSLKVPKPQVDSKLGLLRPESRAETTRTENSRKRTPRENFSVDLNQSRLDVEESKRRLLILKQKKKLMIWDAEREAKKTLENEEKMGMIVDIKERLNKESDFKNMIKQKIHEHQIEMRKIKEEKVIDDRQARQKLQQEEKNIEKEIISNHIEELRIKENLMKRKKENEKSELQKKAELIRKAKENLNKDQKKKEEEQRALKEKEKFNELEFQKRKNLEKKKQLERDILLFEKALAPKQISPVLSARKNGSRENSKDEFAKKKA